MNRLIFLHDSLFSAIASQRWLLPTLARFLIVAVLALYYWNSALTKLGDGILGFLKPSAGAYAQIFPNAMEAVGYDPSQLSVWHWAVVVAGTWAEFLLPALLIIGLFARLAAVGMTGFIAVQSLTDLYGHGGITEPKTLGAWFDRFPDHAILDQRSLWVFLLVVVIVEGAGPLSLDRLLHRRRATIT